MRLTSQSYSFPAPERQETRAGITKENHPLLANVFPSQFPRLEALPVSSVIYRSNLKQGLEAVAEPVHLPLFKKTGHLLRSLKVRNQNLLCLVGNPPNSPIQEL
jgi:hypothetical protein